MRSSLCGRLSKSESFQKNDQNGPEGLLGEDNRGVQEEAFAPQVMKALGKNSCEITF